MLKLYVTRKDIITYLHVGINFLFGNFLINKFISYSVRSDVFSFNVYTVKPVLSGHSNEAQKLFFNTDYCLTQVKGSQNAPAILLTYIKR